MNRDGGYCLYAPDVLRGPDGRYYLYYVLDKLSVMSVAVSDTPAGTYEYYGCVQYPGGEPVGEREGGIYQFDPGVFMDSGGSVYLYSGFAPREEWVKGRTLRGRRIDGASCMELEHDMLTVKRGPSLLVPGPEVARGTGFDGHAFFEASSMRKIGGRYVFVYSSINSHELCYAVSDCPDGGFVFGGTIISNGDVFLNGRTFDQAAGYMGNNHGSLVEVNGHWYIFYHRQTNRHGFSRQGCAEPVFIGPEGTICQVEMTSCGLNGGPLAGTGRYEARIACNLLYRGSGGFYGNGRDYAEHPYFTQTGTDREENGDQYIANMRDGSMAGFKYFMSEDAKRISVETRGTAKGVMDVLAGQDGEPLARVSISPSAEYCEFTGDFCCPDGVFALYFRYEGEGALDFRAFRLS